jgi:Uma2 family endonuclease
MRNDRVILKGVSWDAYTALLRGTSGNLYRLTYEKGILEIMSSPHTHEQYGALIGQMIEAFTEEANISRHSGRSTAFLEETAQVGLEPDECYWIQNEPAMRGKKDFNPGKDPPPDLCVEIDLQRSTLDRMRIYAQLRIPEVWRFDGEKLTIYLLQNNDEYALSRSSAALPSLPPEEVEHYMSLSNVMDEVGWIRSFRSWVRETLLPFSTIGDRKPRRKRRA